MSREDRTEEVLGAIDDVLVEGAVDYDWSVSPDAMRWSPEPPAEPAPWDGVIHTLPAGYRPATNERRIGIEQLATGGSLEFYSVGLVADPLPYCEARVIDRWEPSEEQPEPHLTLIGWIGQYRVLEDDRLVPGDAEVSVEVETSDVRHGALVRRDITSQRRELRLGAMSPVERATTLARFSEAYALGAPLVPARPAFTTEELRQVVEAPPATGWRLGIDVAVDPSLPPSVMELRDDHGAVRARIQVDE